MTRKDRILTGLVLVFILGLLMVHGLLFAQKRIHSTNPQLRMKWYDAHVAMKDKSLFKNVPWQFLGPTNVSGRMTDVDVVTPKGDHYTIYTAGASGGAWKTTNEGTTWEPVFQHAASTAIGDIAITPSNQDIVWIGTGEANIFRSSQSGAGVYKSTDAGKTWNHMGLAGTHTIPRIVVHPTNPDIVYVASSGHEWTDNKERGVYKTIDGGDHWTKVFYVNPKTGVIDLVLDPSNPETLYAATWQRIRKKWNDPRVEKGYSGSGVYKTTDGGKTWTPVNNGLPDSGYRGRIGIDLCQSQSNVIYAFIDNYDKAEAAYEGETDAYGRPKGDRIKGAAVYRSDNGGAEWRQVSENSDYMLNLNATYGWVFGQMRVDPNNPDKIYVMGLQLNVSEDGGKTFRVLRGMHVDHHGLWIDPDNSDYLVNANDGGVVISYDGGANWQQFTRNLPLAQFFNIMHDMDTPFHVYGSMQDHGSYRGAVDLSRGRNNIPAVEFEGAPGGEGSSHAIDPTNPDIVYSAGFYGSLSRSDLSTGERKNILPKIAEGEPKLRGQWVAPFIISPHNPQIIYHGMQYLFRTLDRGETWERISPDLTYNSPKRSGDISYQTLFAISESPLKFGLIYAGTDDGRVHVTKNGGLTWKEIVKGLPYGKWVSRLVASAYDEATVFMTQNGKRDDDFAAYVWKSTNYGKNWMDISNNIPCGPVNVIREDPKNKNVLYVGTDLGVYVSVNGGRSWQSLPKNIPTAYVHDLIVHPRDDIMVAATHGRGMWAMDVRHIQKLDNDLLAKDAFLYKIEAAELPRWRWRRAAGATFHYYLNKAQDITLAVLNADGETIRKLKGTGDAGLNVAEWDLMTEKEEKKEAKYVKPGIYTIRLTAGTTEVEETIEVKGR
ncbi:hypothetical protein ACFL6A_02365 [bacterium]